MDEAWQFTCCETRLYFYLIKTANRLGWVNNWTHSDEKTAANVGVSRNVMKTARNRLIQAGLIAVKSGGNGNGSKTRYQILTPKSTPNLIPNLTPNLIPKSTPLNKLKLNNNIEVDKSTSLSDVNPTNPVKHPKTIEKTEAIDYDSLVDFFNTATGCAFGNIQKPLGAKRKQLVQARIRERGKDAFAQAIKKAAASDFLKGQNQRGFTATFDWIIKPSNFEKILSGNYDNEKNKRVNTAGVRPSSEELNAAVEIGLALAESE